MNLNDNLGTLIAREHGHVELLQKLEMKHFNSILSVTEGQNEPELGL